MTSTAPVPVPIVVFGKDPKIARSVIEKLHPDFEVLHVCLDLDAALAEFPPQFSQATDGSTGSPPPIPAPSSGLGTNAYTSDPAKRRAKGRPQAVLFGGKFSNSEYHAIVKAVEAAAGTADQAAQAGEGELEEQQEQNNGDDDGKKEDELAPPPLGGCPITGIFTRPTATTLPGGQPIPIPPLPPVQPPVHFIKVQKWDVLAAGSLGPNPDVIARVFRRKLAAAVEAAAAGAQTREEK